MHLLTLFVTALSLTTSVYALESRDGKDEGQSFCIGPCGAFEDSLKCDKPFGSHYDEKSGCYMCCILNN